MVRKCNLRVLDEPEAAAVEHAPLGSRSKADRRWDDRVNLQDHSRAAASGQDLEIESLETDFFRTQFFRDQAFWE